MSKLTKNERIYELERKVETLYKMKDYHGKWLAGLNQAVPFGLAEQRLKQLDHLVFDGVDEKWRFAAVDADTEARLHSNRPHGTDELLHKSHGEELSLGRGYDTTNWQNSLIERETKELTGSDLTRAMLERGDKIVTCATSDISDADAIKYENYDAIISCGGYVIYPFDSSGSCYMYAVPINNQGEPLTAADVGL